MEKTTIIQLFSKLGKLFSALGKEEAWSGFSSGLTEEEYIQLETLLRKEQQYNPWFTRLSICRALISLGEMLEEGNLTKFSESYTFTHSPKKVAIIMAGNIPMVGFHDLLCVVLSGHNAVCKLSSDDKRLLPAFINVLTQWNPEISQRIEIAVGPIKKMDAVIATGSTNSLAYFESYFGKYPHIFRKNRTSVAVLDGSETPEQLVELGKDMFWYFGLGCRNVSKIFLPETFDINRIFEAIVEHGDIVNHHKYANNYDYNRTIYLMNMIPFLDNNFCLLREDEGLHSPLSVFHTQRYVHQAEVENFIKAHVDEIQVIIGKNYTEFGKAQTPAIDDFADNVNTMKWLENI